MSEKLSELIAQFIKEYPNTMETWEWKKWVALAVQLEAELRKWREWNPDDEHVAECKEQWGGQKSHATSFVYITALEYYSKRLEELFSILESKGVELQNAFEKAYEQKKKLDDYLYVPLTGEFMSALHDHAIIAKKVNRDYYYEEPMNEVIRLKKEIEGWITAMKLIAQGDDRGAAIAHSALQNTKG